MTAAVAALAGLLPTSVAQATVASGGEGRFVGAIDWVTWEAGPLDLTGPLVRTSTTVHDGVPLSVTCTLSNFAREGGGTPALNGYRPGTYGGDGLDDLYNIGGTGGQNTLVNAISAVGQQVNFDVGCSATLDGDPFPLGGLVIGDAELNGASEFFTATVDSSATWRLIDRFRGTACALDGALSRSDASGESTVRFHNPDGGCGGNTGPMAVLFADGATSGRVSILGGGTTAIALGVVIGFDHGDAPASYGDASHALDLGFSGGELAAGLNSVFDTPLATADQPSLRLGVSVDPEAGFAGPGADGDDVHGSNGAFGPDDDETNDPDSPIVVKPGDTYRHDGIACTGSGTLAGWIDFDGSGTFDADERSGTATCAAGTADLAWTVPTDVTTQADGYVRLRYAADAADIAGPVGLARSGEAEDHRVQLVAEPWVEITGPDPDQRLLVGEETPGIFACGDGVSPLECTATVTLPGGGTSAITDGDDLPTTVPGTYTITATVEDADGRTRQASRTYTVHGPPSASITGPADDARVTQGVETAGRFACAASAGVASCTAVVTLPDGTNVPLTEGGRVPTDLPGEYEITVTVVDELGQTHTTTRRYTVVTPPVVTPPVIDPDPTPDPPGTLRITKRITRTTLRPGQRTQVRSRVVNDTDRTLRNVRVCQRIPAGLRFVSAQPAARRSSGQYCWTIKTLGPGKYVTRSMTLRAVNRPRRVTVRTTARANGQPTSTRNGSIRILAPRSARTGGVTG
ncbi:MAG: CshA/CshB family fibrillar adhesin-related protein [Solirubrobacteraceae bacterium]|nr:CshA/CshB family fibrillar adhesin-related protein [Solirubrobacteraceae bacterium]